MPTILITGAAGHIGTMLRTRLARPGRTLRLLDAAPRTAAYAVVDYACRRRSIAAIENGDPASFAA